MEARTRQTTTINTHDGITRVSVCWLEAVDMVSIPVVANWLSFVATSVVESVDPLLSSLVKSILYRVVLCGYILPEESGGAHTISSIMALMLICLKIESLEMDSPSICPCSIRSIEIRRLVSEVSALFFVPHPQNRINMTR